MNACWYVMHTKPFKEEFLRDQLCLRRIEAYCPLIRIHTVNPRARKIKPYFPGYLFIHVDLNKTSPTTLQWMPGVCGFVSFGGEPTSISDSLIQVIHQRVDQANEAGGELFHDLKAGDELLIIDGPFTGYEAIFDARLPGSERVRVLLKLLSRQQILLVLPTGQVQHKKSPLRFGR